MNSLISDKPTNVAIYAITQFPSAYSTLPSYEAHGQTSRQITETVAPSTGPYHVTDKAKAVYSVTCLLCMAGYVGKTAERFPPGAQGKMRSGAHMTESAWFAFDLDKLTWGQYGVVQTKLESSKAVFCIYTTHSHGSDPREVRVRVLLFMDRALSPAEWAAAWHVANRELLDSKADLATARVSQQAGVWATSPERAAQAFRVDGGTRLLSADALIARVPPKPARAACTGAEFGSNEWSLTDWVARVKDALGMFGPADYPGWIKALCGLKGCVIAGHLSSADARALWLSISESASAEAKARNDDPRYNPESMWDRWTPSSAPAEALVGALFGHARDVALAQVRGELGLTALTERGEAAARYLAQYHWAAFKTLQAEVAA